MKIHTFFKNVDGTTKNCIDAYLNGKKMNRLTSLLRHGNFNVADLKINAEYFIKHNAFSIKFDLRIGKKRLISEEKTHNVKEAFEIAFDKLVNQLRKLESIKHDK
jgi:ribosome-associated translation inhibitor RaiA